MQFLIKPTAPNPLSLPPRILAIVGYAFDRELTTPSIKNIHIDDHVIGVLTTSIDGIEFSVATIDEIEEVIDRVAFLMRLSQANKTAFTKMFFDKLYQGIREEFACH